ncbi:hypothetical protein TSUD_316240 [Trifolium subterraneum]|uniref:Uncharacterized protein n=1 Tax=Trifolium subterraneum TaxID=3900 RepID=A0A2Z6MVC1_TRISU|nr:hypothetical protein TSUD_316240 [Trifolium subterraneum]
MQRRSSEWLLRRKDGPSSLFYEWLVDPPDYILRKMLINLLTKGAAKLSGSCTINFGGPLPVVGRTKEEYAISTMPDH